MDILQLVIQYGPAVVKAMGYKNEDVDAAVESITGGGIGSSLFSGGSGISGFFKNQGKKFLGKQALKSLTGGGSGSSFFAKGLPLIGGALALGYYTNPLREGSYNYNPELQGQIDYVKGLDGYYGINSGSGLGQYGPNSVLSGQNVISGFGTNDYREQLQDKIDKLESIKKKGYNTIFGKKSTDFTDSQQELLNKAKEEQDNFDWDQVDKDMAADKTKSTATPTTQRGPNEGGGGGGSSGGGGAPSHSTRNLMAKGGDVLSRRTGLNDEARKESQVKQFTPPPEKTGILQKLFGIDTDKLYDQGFDSMNKYRERNPDNPREVLQTAGGKLSNLRHGVSTSLLRDAILKKINPGSYEMKEAPPSMNFKELKMSEEGPNKAAKGVASLLAYLGAGSNEIGTDFFSQETMEDLTANLLGLMKTDVYDTPKDKAAMLNEILENDTGGINTYLQSLAPKEKYQEDDSLFPPMRQDKMRDQDLLFMKAEEDYEDKVKNLGLGAMDG
jgi:hypothetical protein